MWIIKISVRDIILRQRMFNGHNNQHFLTTIDRRIDFQLDKWPTSRSRTPLSPPLHQWNISTGLQNLKTFLTFLSPPQSTTFFSFFFTFYSPPTKKNPPIYEVIPIVWKQFSLLPTFNRYCLQQTRSRWDKIIPISFTQNKNQSLHYKLKTFNSRPLASSLIFFLLLFIARCCPATSRYLLTPEQVVVLNTLPLVQPYTLPVQGDSHFTV